MAQKSGKRMNIQGRERPAGLSACIEKIEGRWFGDARVSIEGLELKLVYFGINEHHERGAFPVHVHPFMELFYTLSGQGWNSNGAQEQLCDEGCVYYIPQGAKHGSRWNMKKSEAWRGVLFQFDVNLDPELLSRASDLTLVEQFAPFYAYFVLERHGFFQLPRWARKSFRETVASTLLLMREHPAVGNARAVGLWIEMISLISICLQDTGKDDSHGLVLRFTDKEKRLLLARQLLQDESRTELDIRKLAKQIGMSEYHFIREFRQQFGVTPHKYRQTLLMESAAKLLVQTDWPVYEIAEQLHYADSSAFSKSFRKYAGLSPQAYRAHWVHFHD